MQKRPNPFATPIVENPVDSAKQPEQKVYYEETVVDEPVYVSPKQAKVLQRQSYAPVKKVEKEKFTSVMDPDIRRKVKIACATRGILFAQYVEDACKEKLRREGDM